MWYPGLDPGTVNGRSGKNKNWRNPNKVYSLVNSNVSIFIP